MTIRGAILQVSTTIKHYQAFLTTINHYEPLSITYQQLLTIHYLTTTHY